jgi:type I restriction enzyme S subunit
MGEWKETTLGEISSKPQYGWTTKSSRVGRVRYLRTTDISKSEVNWDTVPFCVDEPEVVEKYQLEDGDILVSRAGSVGFSYMVQSPPNNVVFASYLIRFKVTKAFPNLIYHYLHSPLYWEAISSMSAGIAVQNINATKLRELKINLPKRIEDQEKLSDVLDRFTVRQDKIEGSLSRLPGLLADFRESVLWRFLTDKVIPAPIIIGEPAFEAENGWNWVELVKIANLESGHTPRKSIPEYWEGGDVPWISLRDIRSAHGTVITKTESMPTQLGIDNSSARLLPKGTVCFSRDISVGYTTIMGREMATTQHFANWVCGPEIENRYLMYALMLSKRSLTDQGAGTTVKTIYMPALKSMRILLPDPEQQLSIVNQIDKLFSFADQIETRMVELNAKVEDLPQAVLGRAFRGQL